MVENNIKHKDLIKDNYYVAKSGNIFKYFGGNNASYYLGSADGFPPNQTFNGFGGGFKHDQNRLATSEEKHWLNVCITNNKFITFKEAMKTFKSNKIYEIYY